MKRRVNVWLALLLVLAVCVPVGALAYSTDDEFDPTLVMEMYWKEGNSFDVLRPFGLEPAEDGRHPLWNGVALNGLVDEAKDTWQYFDADAKNHNMLDMEMREDGLYAKVVYDDKGAVSGLEEMDYETYAKLHPMRRPWEDGWLAPLKAYGVTEGEQYTPVYEGRHVEGVIDGNSSYYTSLYDVEAMEPIPPDEDAIYLRVLYDDAGKMTGVEALEEGELPEWYMTYAKMQESDKEQEEKYAPYKEFGLVDGIYQKDQYVLGFLDPDVAAYMIRDKDSKMMETVPEGVWGGYVYLVAERDDAGELTGLREVSMAEYLELGGFDENGNMKNVVECDDVK